MIDFLYRLNVKYDNMEENRRFLLFFFLICIPLSLLFTFNFFIGLVYSVVLFIFRVVIPRIH